MGENLVYAVRGNTGFSLRRGLTNDVQTLFEDNKDPKSNPCEVFEFSSSGHIFAYCDEQRTRAIEVSTGREVFSSDLRRTRSLLFSPKDTLLLTFEQYTIYGKRVSADQKPEPNLRVFNLADGRHVTTLIAQKEATWKPQWTEDESVAVRLVGSELLFHKGNAFEKYDRKLVVPGIGDFSLSPGPGPHHIACYTAAAGANPARVQVRRLNDEFTIIANKTFFKSDKAHLTWNHKGTALLIESSVEVDSSNQSYYGEQTIYMVNVQTDEAFKVPLAKTGPVYAAKWNPNGKEFAVCYGYMPAKVTFYNLRGEVTFDGGEGPRNDLFYNAFGNIVLICGFGNLAKGKMDFWDVEKKKEIISIDVPNTTQFEWAPDGQHFMTATTTPRLRIDNSYRLWHYSGKLIREISYDSPREELWQVKFRPMKGYNKFEVKELTKAERLQAGLLIKKKDAAHPLNNVPAGSVRQTGAYVPPHLRNSKPGAPTGNVAEGMKPVKTEVEKKMHVLNKKLADIKTLKEKEAKGEKLQRTQLEKVNNESKFLAELAALKLEQ